MILMFNITWKNYIFKFQTQNFGYICGKLIVARHFSHSENWRTTGDIISRMYYAMCTKGECAFIFPMKSDFIDYLYILGVLSFEFYIF